MRNSPLPGLRASTGQLAVDSIQYYQQEGQLVQTNVVIDREGKLWYALRLEPIA